MMAGYGAVVSEMGDDHVSGGPCGYTTRNQYYWTETGDAQVCGLTRTEARWELSVDREGGGISLGGKSSSGRGGQGGKD